MYLLPYNTILSLQIIETSKKILLGTKSLATIWQAMLNIFKAPRQWFAQPSPEPVFIKQPQTIKSPQDTYH